MCFSKIILCGLILQGAAFSSSLADPFTGAGADDDKPIIRTVDSVALFGNKPDSFWDVHEIGNIEDSIKQICRKFLIERNLVDVSFYGTEQFVTGRDSHKRVDYCINYLKDYFSSLERREDLESKAADKLQLTDLLNALLAQDFPLFVDDMRKNYPLLKDRRSSSAMFSDASGSRRTSVDTSSPASPLGEEQLSGLRI